MGVGSPKVTVTRRMGDVGFDLVSFSNSTIILDHAVDLNQQNLTAVANSTVHYQPFDMTDYPSRRPSRL